MTHTPLARLLAEVGWSGLGAEPTVNEAGAVMADLFTRVQEADRAEAKANAADDDSSAGTQHAGGLPDELIRRAAALALLRSAVLGTLLAVRPGKAPEDEQPGPVHQGPEGSLWQRTLSRISPPVSPPTPAPPPEPVVIPELLSVQVANAFGSADGLLDLTKPPEPVESERPWAKDKILIDLFHQMLEAAAVGDGEHLLRLVAGLRKDLGTLHDIQVVDFDENTARHFGPVEKPDGPGATVRTIRPAMLYEGQFLRRGQAVAVQQQAAVPAPDTHDSPRPESEQEVANDGEDR